MESGLEAEGQDGFDSQTRVIAPVILRKIQVLFDGSCQQKHPSLMFCMRRWQYEFVGRVIRTYVGI